MEITDPNFQQRRIPQRPRPHRGKTPTFSEFCDTMKMIGGRAARVFWISASVGTVIANQLFPTILNSHSEGFMSERKSRLLIVDDESHIRDVLHDFLSRSYECMAVNSAEDALTLLTTEAFDLIISDITMKRMNGLEMVPHVRNLAPHAVVIMLSGQRTIEFAIEAMRAGAFDYITKPFDLSEVDAAVRRALAHAKLLKDKLTRANGSDENSVKRLRSAVENEEFVVYYQPQVDIESRSVIGAEALVRWDHPELGLLPPVDFIPLAEETGLIVPIGAAVLREACSQAQNWHQAGFPDFRVAVNVSPRQLQEGNLEETIVQILNETGCEPDCLELEVTESSMMQPAESEVRTLVSLRRRGLRISIDDFGTGYSSLGYLKHLPIDSVKLDQSFVKGATVDPDDAALVMAIMTLAHNLRLKVIAEGIETEDQFRFLRLLRCDEGQGYLFGSPVPPDGVKPFNACGLISLAAA